MTKALTPDFGIHFSDLKNVNSMHAFMQNIADWHVYIHILLILKTVTPKTLYFGTGIASVKMAAKFEILSL